MTTLSLSALKRHQVLQLLHYRKFPAHILCYIYVCMYCCCFVLGKSHIPFLFHPRDHRFVNKCKRRRITKKKKRPPQVIFTSSATHRTVHEPTPKLSLLLLRQCADAPGRFTPVFSRFASFSKTASNCGSAGSAAFSSASSAKKLASSSITCCNALHSLP